MKVLCIGHSSYDISCEVEGFPAENTKHRLQGSVRCGGGPAGNAAYLLGKWGVDTTIATVLGADDFGEKIKKEFSEVKVDTSCIETNFESPTSLSFIMVDKTNGNRTVFNVADAPKALKKYNYDFTPDIIFTDGHDYGAMQNAITKYPNAISVIDAGRVTSELLELCKYMKYIVCSKGFAETVTNMKIDYETPSTLVNVYLRLQEKYPNAILVVTLEEKGALYKDENQIKIMPGLKVEAKDTTGAGDIFHGAFVYGLVNNFDIEKTVTFANIAGGLSCKEIGSRYSIPTLSAVLDEYTKKVQAQQPAVDPNVQVTPEQNMVPTPNPEVAPVVSEQNSGEMPINPMPEVPAAPTDPNEGLISVAEQAPVTPEKPQ